MLLYGAIDKERGGRPDDTFERALVPLKDDLGKYCRSVTGNRWDADDLLQETVTKAYVRYVHTGRAEFNKAYLYRIASNAWIDRIRKDRREVAMPSDWFVRDEQDMPDGSQFEDTIDARWALQRIVGWLPEKQRTVFLLTEAFDLSLSETARYMGVTEGAVKSLLRRGRDRLARFREDETECCAADEALVQAYLRALRTGDVGAVVSLGRISPVNLAGAVRPGSGASARVKPAIAARAGLGFAAVPEGTSTFAVLDRTGGRPVVRIVTARAGDAIAV
ncbi:RNA polymerase sigma factor [Paenibacillus alkalitolerans]|uniref:RNA polymerase sigma factor n=1 Tax=Paenibacillus alkalitolerans TaxID=2799335 RepID=UPI0018F4B552|nr:RNA polymerase sigma factor [Paenibacillus alkalitolerans]